MGAIATMGSDPKKVTFGNDDVVIRQYIGGIIGGRTLDMTDFSEDVIQAGHVVIRALDEDGENYTYKPMPVSDGAYGTLPDKYEYAGVVVRSKPKEEPFVGIMDDGRVNDIAMPYPLTSDMKTAIKTALPKLIFEHD